MLMQVLVESLLFGLQPGVAGQDLIDAHDHRPLRIGIQAPSRSGKRVILWRQTAMTRHPRDARRETCSGNLARGGLRWPAASGGPGAVEDVPDARIEQD